MLALLTLLVLETDDSLAALDREIAKAPASPLPRIDAAEKRLTAGEQLDRALLDLDVARALIPENPRVHFLFGQLMEERGQKAEARVSYETALALREEYDEARFRLAGLLLEAGAFAEAAKAYAKYVKTHPDATGARLQLSAALEKAGDKAGAEKELKALYQDPKTREMGARKLAELYDRTGRERDATKVRTSIEPPKRKLRDLQRSAR